MLYVHDKDIRPRMKGKSEYRKEKWCCWCWRKWDQCDLVTRLDESWRVDTYSEVLYWTQSSKWTIKTALSLIEAKGIIGQSQQTELDSGVLLFLSSLCTKEWTGTEDKWFEGRTGLVRSPVLVFLRVVFQPKVVEKYRRSGKRKRRRKTLRYEFVLSEIHFLTVIFTLVFPLTMYYYSPG